MDYDPFARGPFPVGVRSGRIIDRNREDRELPFEVWHPAAQRHRGLDLAPATQDTFKVLADGPVLQQAAVRDAELRPGTSPLILFSHTSAGHRRQSTFLCTHLASHGYIVAAADHIGNTALDLAERSAAGVTPTRAELDAYIERIIADRVPDLRFLLDELLRGAAGDASNQLDPERIGLVGWSFGGWAALATLEEDDRFGAVVALAPAGNSKPLPGIIPATLTFAWKREVPALLLVAEHDRFTPLPGIEELYQRTPSRKAMFVLRNADHEHFGDQIESGAIPPEHAHLFTRSLALAHLDAVLREIPVARQFMSDDPIAGVRAHGVAAYAYTDRPLDSGVCRRASGRAHQL